MESQMGRSSKREARRLELVARFGGGCQECGYHRCTRALQFHHLDSSEKESWSNGAGRASLDEIEAHPERFRLLCANCHFETHHAIHVANRTKATCVQCGKEFELRVKTPRPGRDRHCSRECFQKARVISSETREAVSARIRRNVSDDGGCWVWNKALAKDGSPHAVYTTAVDGKHRLLSARNLSLFAFLNVPLVANRKTRVSCGKKDCVNPRHILVYSGSGWNHVDQPITELIEGSE
jgi:hypothetical protein